jgi:hypothetical protein
MALEPLCEDTYMVVDGEVVPKRTLYIELHPSLCRTCVSPSHRVK